MRDKPTPVFVHHGIESGALSLSVATLNGEDILLVGTANGKCLMYSMRTHLKLKNLYGEIFKRIS